MYISEFWRHHTHLSRAFGTSKQIFFMEGGSYVVKKSYLSNFFIFRQAVDAGEEQCLRQREISEEVEETEEWYMTELTEREATYQTQLAQWRASRKMRVREGGGEGGGREGGRERGRGWWREEREGGTNEGGYHREMEWSLTSLSSFTTSNQHT